MRHRTAVKTGRTAAMQVGALGRRAFSDYAAMVERLAAPGFPRLWRRMRELKHRL